MQANKPNLFKVYNAARKPLRAWMRTREFTPLQTECQMQRLNRALGIIQAGDFSHREKYQTTTKTCGCWDAKSRPEFLCKHRLAERMSELMEALAAQTPQVQVTKFTLSNLVREARVNFQRRTFFVSVTYARSDTHRVEVYETTPIGEIGVEPRLREQVADAVLSFNQRRLF